MAEPKDEPDAPHFIHKVSNHLGNSRLEESLNDFLDLHSEELRLELRRVGSPLVSEEGDSGEPLEQGSGGQEQGGPGVENGAFGHRVHCIYQEFLSVVQGNLEEFLEAEGLTEAQLRDACEQEMQAKDPGGLSFMHTLISSWEFSSFIALVSSFLDEGSDVDDEDDDDDEDDGDASSSSASFSFHREEGAESLHVGFDGGGRRDHGQEGAESMGLDDMAGRGRSPRCTCNSSGSNSSRRRTSSSRSCSTSSSTSTRSCRSGVARTLRSASPAGGAASVVVVADDSIVVFSDDEARKGSQRPLVAVSTCIRGLEGVSQSGGGGRGDGGAAAASELDGKVEKTRGKRSGVAEPACCRGRSGGSDDNSDPPGTKALISEARGTAGFNARGRRRSVPELPARAEAKN